MKKDTLMGFFLKNTYSKLLAVLLFFFFAAPFLPQRDKGTPLFTVLFFGSVILALKAIGMKRRVYYFSILSGLVVLCVEVTLNYAPQINKYLQGMFFLVIGFTYALFLAMAVFLIAKRLFSASSVNIDTIQGAVAVYLLLGFLGMVMYSILAAMDGHSFAFLVSGEPANFFYYSFVTMTTIGYGDIVPMSRLAQTLSCAQAVTGQMFIAIIIARLVGLQITAANERARHNHEREKNEEKS